MCRIAKLNRNECLKIVSPERDELSTFLSITRRDSSRQGRNVRGSTPRLTQLKFGTQVIVMTLMYSLSLVLRNNLLITLFNRSENILEQHLVHSTKLISVNHPAPSEVLFLKTHHEREVASNNYIPRGNGQSDPKNFNSA